MKVYGLALDLKDDPATIEKYKEYHRNPWPEPLAGLRQVGVTEMKIFLLGTRMFMYMATTDECNPEVDFPRYTKENPKAAEWDALMRTYQQLAPGAKEGEWWALMDKVFDMDDHV